MNDVIHEDSQSVQSHLNILQSIIQRMSANSASLWSWLIKGSRNIT